MLILPITSTLFCAITSFRIDKQPIFSSLGRNQLASHRVPGNVAYATLQFDVLEDEVLTTNGTGYIMR